MGATSLTLRSGDGVQEILGDILKEFYQTWIVLDSINDSNKNNIDSLKITKIKEITIIKLVTITEQIFRYIKKNAIDKKFVSLSDLSEKKITLQTSDFTQMKDYSVGELFAINDTFQKFEDISDLMKKINPGKFDNIIGIQNTSKYNTSSTSSFFSVETINEIFDLRHSLIHSINHKIPTKQIIVDYILCVEELLAFSIHILLNISEPKKQSMRYFWSSKGIMFHLLQKYQKAIGCYEELIKLDPKNGDSWYNKAICLTLLEKDSESLSFYNKTLEINPKDVDALQNKTNTLTNLEKYDEALITAKILLKLNPKNHAHLNNIGIIFAKQDKHSQAITQFKKAIDLSPKQLKYLYNLGLTYQNQDDYSNALKQYELVLDINPKYMDTQSRKKSMLSHLNSKK